MKTVLSAGIVLVSLLKNTEYLILRSGNYWDFPKGLVSDAEDPLTAAIRELKEETGIENINFLCNFSYIETLPYGQFKKIARYYLANVSYPIPEIVFSINPELGYPEHDEFRWCSYKECKSLLGVRVGNVLDWAEMMILSLKR